jgi:HEPN domain-containing protein
MKQTGSFNQARSTPHGFWRFAADYYFAAEAVRTFPGPELLMPALQLYGQAIELALKAFLMQRGNSLQEVKNLSHGLSEILLQARKRKLGREIKLTRSDIALIDLLDINYVAHRFRYIQSGSTRVPTLLSISKVTERILAGLEKYCTGACRGLKWNRRGYSG